MARRVVLAALMTVVSSAAAAADLEGEPVAVEATPTGVMADWSGVTIGALFGYRFGEAEAPGLSFDANGFEGGLFAGANVQYDRAVFGLEADFAVTGIDDTENGVTLDEAWNASVRGRAGLALDDFLVYGTAGLAAAKIEARAGALSDDATALGLTVGAGIEKALSERVTARVEYRYTEYEEKTFSLGPSSTTVDLSDSTVRAGVGVRF